MKIYHKITALVLIAVILLTGCSSTEISENQTDTEEKEIIHFYSWVGDAEQECVRTLISQYEKTHTNIDIVDTYVPYGEYISKLCALKASGNMPEVFQLIEGMVLEWGNTGALLDLKPYFDREGIDLWEKRVSSSVFAADGKVYGVGWDLITICLYYNKELFAENGIEPPPTSAEEPWTWDEFVNAAKKLTKDVNGKTPEDSGFDPNSIITYGTVMPANWTKLLALLRTNGASFASEDGMSFTLNTPEAIEVINSIKELSEKEHCSPDYATSVNLEANIPAMIMNGQVGMMIEGSWNLPNYTNAGFDIGVAQIPMFKEPANVMWSTSLCISSEFAGNQAAFDFLQYATDYNNQLTAAMTTGISPSAVPNVRSIFSNENELNKWIKAYTKVDGTQFCNALKNIVEHDNTKLGENITLKNFNIMLENKITPALEAVYLDEEEPEEAFSAVDLSAELAGIWK